MATIRYYLNPAEAADIDQCQTVGESLLSRFPDGIAPRGLRIYRGECAQCNDVTEDIKSLCKPSDDTFNVVVEAGEITTTALAIISIVVGVASVLLAPDPNVTAPPNANRRQQSPNNSFGARSNEARPNQRSADIRGKQPNAYPDLWQVPYRKFRDSIEYEYIYGQVSEGYLLTQNWRDGATQFGRIVGGRLAVYGPGTSPLSGTPELVIGGSAPTELLYDVTQSNEVSGATLPPPNGSAIANAVITVESDGTVSIDGGVDLTTSISVGDSVVIRDFYYFDFIDPTIGYARFDLNGTYEVLSVSPLSMTLDADWSIITEPSGYELLRIAWTNGAGNWRIDDPSDPEFYPVNFYPLIEGIGNVGPAGPFSCSGFDRLWVNIVAPNGIYKDDGSNTYSEKAEYQVTIYELDSNGIRTGQLTQSSNRIIAAEDLKNYSGSTLEVVIPYSFAEVEVERTSLTDKTFSGTVVDEIKWRDLYLVNDVAVGDLDVSYATTVHAEIKATESALRVKDRKLNCTATRLIAEHTGSGNFASTESTVSDMFADVIASIWRDPLFGRGEDDEVNWQQLFDMQADMVTYYGGDNDPCRVGYTFDSDKITAEDAIKLICNAVNVIPYRIGSVLNFWFERPQSQSAMQFGHRFKHPGTDQRSRGFGPEDDKTGVELTYFDENTEVFETVLRGSDINPLKIELSGCITPRGAQIKVDREWNKLRYSRIQHGFDATALGREVVPGMRIDVVDNTRYAPYNGEIRAVDGLTLKISQPVTLDTPTDYSVVLTRSDGTLESIAIASQSSPDTVTLATAPGEPPQVGRNADKTTYSIGTDDMRTSRAMLVREISPKEYNKVGIGCINYDDRYYSEDNS